MTDVTPYPEQCCLAAPLRIFGRALDVWIPMYYWIAAHRKALQKGGAKDGRRIWRLRCDELQFHKKGSACSRILQDAAASKVNVTPCMAAAPCWHGESDNKSAGGVAAYISKGSAALDCPTAGQTPQQLRCWLTSQHGCAARAN